jgi:hypothetical protein
VNTVNDLCSGRFNSDNVSLGRLKSITVITKRSFKEFLSHISFFFFDSCRRKERELRELIIISESDHQYEQRDRYSYLISTDYI